MEPCLLNKVYSSEVENHSRREDRGHQARLYTYARMPRYSRPMGSRAMPVRARRNSMTLILLMNGRFEELIITVAWSLLC